jgi:hypothetical protein
MTAIAAFSADAAIDIYGKETGQFDHTSLLTKMSESLQGLDQEGRAWAILGGLAGFCGALATVGLLGSAGKKLGRHFDKVRDSYLGELANDYLFGDDAEGHVSKSYWHEQQVRQMKEMYPELRKKADIDKQTFLRLYHCWSGGWGGLADYLQEHPLRRRMDHKTVIDFFEQSA